MSRLLMKIACIYLLDHLGPPLDHFGPLTGPLAGPLKCLLCQAIQRFLQLLDHHLVHCRSTGNPCESKAEPCFGPVGPQKQPRLSNPGGNYSTRQQQLISPSIQKFGNLAGPIGPQAVVLVAVRLITWTRVVHWPVQSVHCRSISHLTFWAFQFMLIDTHCCCRC